MLERMAMALAEAAGDQWAYLPSQHETGWSRRQMYLRMAEAALKAMREPTDAQIKACIDAAETIQGGGWIEVYKRIYRIMIDAALSQVSPSGEEQ